MALYPTTTAINQPANDVDVLADAQQCNYATTSNVVLLCAMALDQAGFSEFSKLRTS